MAHQDKFAEDSINELTILQSHRKPEESIDRLTYEIKNLQIIRARQEAIIEAFDGLIYVCSADLEIEFMNDRFVERTGRNPVGEKCYPALHERNDVCPWCVNDRVQAGQTVHTEVLSPKDNRYYHVINTPVYHPDGSISKMSMIRDITESKLAEQELKTSEERYRKIVEDQTELLCRFLPGGTITFVNQAYCRYFNRHRDSLVGKDFIPLIPETDRDKVFDNIGRLSRSNPVSTHEHRIIAPNGEIRWQEWTNRALFDEQGNIVEYQSVGRDITDLKRAEQALHQRTEELERSNKDLEQFAYIAAHDLREPLLAIAAYLKLLERRYKVNLGADGNKFLAGAINSTLRMDGLIQSLLAYSRVGNEVQCFERTDCNRILDTALANLLSLIEESSAVVTVEDLPTVIANPSQMLQLFQNLVSNAIKFAGDTPPKIHVGVTRNDNEWQYFVKDNGIGIEPPYFDRIFLLFQRIKNRANYPGTGIGLANCRRIVEHHGGRIWVESTPGKGSTFFFTIPDRLER